jgi:hypothetical protein
VLAAVYATGAFSSTTAEQSADVTVAGDAAAFLTLETSEGPNGQFASYGSDGALQVRMGEGSRGVNPGSRTSFQKIITIPQPTDSRSKTTRGSLRQVGKFDRHISETAHQTASRTTNHDARRQMTRPTTSGIRGFSSEESSTAPRVALRPLRTYPSLHEPRRDSTRSGPVAASRSLPANAHRPPPQRLPPVRRSRVEG